MQTEPSEQYFIEEHHKLTEILRQCKAGELPARATADFFRVFGFQAIILGEHAHGCQSEIDDYLQAMMERGRKMEEAASTKRPTWAESYTRWHYGGGAEV